MRKDYAVIAPNSRVLAYAPTWNDAVDKAVDLSLRWGILFSVRRQGPGAFPFKREHAEVLRRAIEYIELARQWPKASRTAKARSHFESAKRRLDRLIQVHYELTGSWPVGGPPLPAVKPCGGNSRTGQRRSTTS